MNEKEKQTWKRAIVFIDMDAFFASVDQMDHPEWRGKPLVVTNGEQGTCIITSSYEARAYGIKTGMRIKEALKRCPHLIRSPSNPNRYAEISRRIMHALYNITPDIEVFSVDEAFLDVTHCQKLHGNPEIIGKMAKECVYNTSGLNCTVGVSGDKTTAKFAAEQKKPNGFALIYPWEAKEQLKNAPVTDLCGIASGIGNFLARYGVFTCGDMEKIPISILAKRFGNLGRRIWYMCQGADPDPVHIGVAPPKSVGHGKVMPPDTTDPAIVYTYLLHMSERVAARLRKHGLEAQYYFIGLRSRDLGWLGDQQATIKPTNEGRLIFELGKSIFKHCWHGEPVCQIQITALDPKIEKMQLDLFSAPRTQQNNVNQLLDAVNQRYGEFMLAPARLLNRSKMHNVIAPAWKPDEHRQSI